MTRPGLTRQCTVTILGGTRCPVTSLNIKGFSVMRLGVMSTPVDSFCKNYMMEIQDSCHALNILDSFVAESDFLEIHMQLFLAVSVALV